MAETRELDVYWPIQNDRRWSVSLSESEAWRSLEHLAAYENDPNGWAVQRTHEMVPLSFGEVVEGDGEVIVLDGDDYAETARQAYKAIHVFWQGRLCGRAHNCSLYRRSRKADGPGF